MKKENLVLVLMFGLMLLLSVIALSFDYLFPTSTVDKMFGQNVNVVNERPVIDPEFNQIFAQAEVTTLDGTKIADLYTVRVDHTYFYLELYVGIDLDGNVYARDKFVNPKDDTSSSYFPLVRAYLLKNYNGLYYENVQFIDGAAGATTIIVSRSIIKSAVSQAVVFHVGVAEDYIETLFDSNYELNDETENDNVIAYDVTVGGVDYTVYKATGNGTYYDFTSTSEGEITIYIAVDSGGEITHTLIPESVYQHSGGNFYTATSNFLSGVIGLNINDPMPDSTTGPTANSDGSQYLVNRLLQDIQGVA